MLFITISFGTASKNVAE